MILGNYLAAVALFCIGLYILLTRRNLIMIVMGFQQDMQYRKSLPESYFQVSFLTRIGYALAYLGLGALLFMLLTQPQVFLQLLVKLGL